MFFICKNSQVFEQRSINSKVFLKRIQFITITNLTLQTLNKLMEQKTSSIVQNSTNSQEVKPTNQQVIHLSVFLARHSLLETWVLHLDLSTQICQIGLSLLGLDGKHTTCHLRMPNRATSSQTSHHLKRVYVTSSKPHNI